MAGTAPEIRYNEGGSDGEAPIDGFITLGLGGGAALVVKMLWALAQDATQRRQLAALNERWREALSAALGAHRPVHLEEASPLLPHRTNGTIDSALISWALQPDRDHDDAQPRARLTLEIEAPTDRHPPFWLSWRPGQRHLPPRQRRGALEAGPHLHDETFAEQFDCGGQELRVLTSLGPDVRDALLELTSRMRWLTVHAGSLSACWSLPARELVTPEAHQLLGRALELGVLLCAPSSQEERAARLATWAHASPHATTERALELLFEHHPDSPHAAAAADTLRARSARRLRLIAALGAPTHLPPGERLGALAWAARHHPVLARRRQALESLVDHDLDEPATHRALEDVSLGEPDDELRATAQAHALRLGPRAGLDPAGVLLAALRTLRRGQLSSTARQRLELVILDTSARPGLATYQRLAARSSDRILRYSSLRALASTFAGRREALQTICERAWREPLPWIATWCRRTLAEAIAQPPQRAHLEAILADTSVHVATRLEAALVDPRAHRDQLLDLLGRQALELPQIMRVLEALTRADLVAEARQAAEARLEACPIGAREALYMELTRLPLAWPMRLICDHLPRMTRATRCALLAELAAAPPPPEPRLEALEQIGLVSLRDRADAVRRRATELLCEIGTARCVPELRGLLSLEEAGLMSRSPAEHARATQAIPRIIQRIHARTGHTSGALTLALPTDHAGALSITHARGQLRLLEDAPPEPPG